MWGNANMDPTQLTEAEGAAKIARRPELIEINGAPVLALPKEWIFKDFTGLLDRPTRKSGHVVLHDLDGFLDHIKRQQVRGASQIYIDVDTDTMGATATAVFNDHGEGEENTGWRDHRALFTPRITKEWKCWLSADRQTMSQARLAEFFETNLGDFTSSGDDGMPSGARVLEFVSNLEETRTVKFRSGTNLQNGMVQVEFVESGNDASKGRLDLFKRFAIGIKPFFGGDAYRLEAFLRYRIDRNSGEISFWYELQRPDRVLCDAVQSIADRIAAESDIPCVYGKPN